MKSKEKVKNIGVLNRRMEKVDLESRLPLEAVFHKLAEDQKRKIYGERQHAKFEGWFYRLEYDFWEKKTSNDSEDVEILSFKGDEDFLFRY